MYVLYNIYIFNVYIYFDMIYKASNDDPGGLHESQRGAGLPLASLGVVDIDPVMGEFPLGQWFQWNKIVECVEKTCGTP
jgi:hypothetical protein